MIRATKEMEERGATAPLVRGGMLCFGAAGWHQCCRSGFYPFCAQRAEYPLFSSARCRELAQPGRQVSQHPPRLPHPEVEKHLLAASPAIPVHRPQTWRQQANGDVGRRLEERPDYCWRRRVQHQRGQFFGCWSDGQPVAFEHHTHIVLERRQRRWTVFSWQPKQSHCLQGLQVILFLLGGRQWSDKHGIEP